MLPTDYRDAVQYATLGHAAWGLNLVGQYTVGHFTPSLPIPSIGGIALGGKLGADFAVNPLMVGFSAVHFAITHMYKTSYEDGPDRNKYIAAYTRKIAMPLNCFLLGVSLATDVFHKFGYWDANSLGLADYERGIYAVSGLQLLLNMLCYGLVLLGEVPLSMGWFSKYGGIKNWA